MTQPVPYCLSDAKGRPSTINKMEGRDSRTNLQIKKEFHTYPSQVNPSKALKEEASILHNYYKPEMQKIYKLIYPELPVTEFCQNETRYKWLKNYLCETQN